METHPHPERLPTQAKLCTFLSQTGRAELCRHLAPKNERREPDPRYPWVAEAALLQELIQAQAASTPDATRINEIRSYLYIATWESAPPPKPDVLRTHMQTLRTIVTESVQRLRGAGPNDREAARDANELEHELQALLGTIETALHARPCDEEGEPAAEAIERIYAICWTELLQLFRIHKVTWETRLQAPRVASQRIHLLMERIQALRPIRNTLYYDRAYKRWCELSHAS